MELDPQFAESIRNALLAADEVSSATAEVAFLAKAIAGKDYFAEKVAFLAGWRAALNTVGITYEIPLQMFEDNRMGDKE